MYCYWIPNNLYTKKQEKHPFHLVDPSPWPFLTAISLFMLAISGVVWFHGISNLPLKSCFIGFLVPLAYFLYRWFQDIITETAYQGHHTRKVVKGLKYGVLLFIVSEVMFFFSLFLAYFYYSISPSIWIGEVWPPRGIVSPNPNFFPLVNTVLLLTSGVLLTSAHAEMIIGNRKLVIEQLAGTLVLSTIFTGFQYLEYKYSSLHINDSVFGSIFYMITGFHGFHVCIGSVFVFACFLRVSNEANITFTRQHHFGFLAAIWYWHFVDVVWLFVFFALYIYPAMLTPYPKNCMFLLISNFL
jgi:heme/copper-type cytochrome/quinol oxidase subunit 3